MINFFGPNHWKNSVQSTEYVHNYGSIIADSSDYPTYGYQWNRTISYSGFFRDQPPSDGC